MIRRQERDDKRTERRLRLKRRAIAADANGVGWSVDELMSEATRRARRQ
ncbi:MAG TPA: hypothetical protein VGB73_15775 [Pyrinomonadaceae bacterium]